MAHRILLVEDEPHQREAMGQLLALRGYDVCTAADAHTAGVLLERESFAAVITDLRLPGGGESVVQRAAALEPVPPVIGVTGVADPEERARLLAHGATDWLAKPVNAARLHASLARALTARPPNSPPRSRGPRTVTTRRPGRGSAP